MGEDCDRAMTRGYSVVSVLHIFVWRMCCLAVLKLRVLIPHSKPPPRLPACVWRGKHPLSGNERGKSRQPTTTSAYRLTRFKLTMYFKIKI